MIVDENAVYVNTLPWSEHSNIYDSNLLTSETIVKTASLDWAVNAEPLYSELHGLMQNYYAMYREDLDKVLGVVKTSNLDIVQNLDTFTKLEHLLGSTLKLDSISEIEEGRKIFGCFKVQENYKCLDDDIEHYFVIVNNHLVPDGKVSIISTPVRVSCSNMLSQAIQCGYKYRVPISLDAENKSKKEINIESILGESMDVINKYAETMVSKRVDNKYLANVLDLVFPYQLSDGAPLDNTYNEKVSLSRDLFISNCMNADNLNNYRGTRWQIFNALLDYEQHYYLSVDQSFSLANRMYKVPGLKGNDSNSKVVQFQKSADKFAV